MTILGLWVAIAGYAVLYAGLANWQGSGMSIPDAFTGKGVVKCGASTPAPTPATGHGGSGVGVRWV